MKKGLFSIWLILLVGMITACGQSNHNNVTKTQKPIQETKAATTKPTETAVATESPAPSPEVVTDETTIQGMARDILKSMTLNEKIGQMFVVNFELLDSSKGNFYEFRKLTNIMKGNIGMFNVGGVIFFARNIETREQTSQFIVDLQNASKIPMFISVDEEGGDVARIANNNNMKTTKFPNMQDVGAMNDPEYANNMGATIGKEIKELGFNLDYAPVADVKTNITNTEIGNRSLGSDPKVVSSLVKEIVTGMQEQGVSSTLKHFPGHGEASEDSHKGAVNVESDLNRLRDVDFLPFRAGIKAGADFIMVSHISISRVTEDTVPSSLSSLVMKDILRKELGFKGIIITDALNMKAITNDYSAGDAAVASVQAGTDMLLMPEDLEQAYFAVFNAVLNGTITEEQINQSVTRILETKIRRGIILSNTNLINKKNVTD